MYAHKHTRKKKVTCVEIIIYFSYINVFNSLNREVALHNIQYICPPFWDSADQHIPHIITSLCNRRKGRHKVMILLWLFPVLQQTLSSRTTKIRVNKIKQVWFADDATGCLHSLKEWLGNKIGYYVNECKSWLILKDVNTLLALITPAHFTPALIIQSCFSIFSFHISIQADKQRENNICRFSFLEVWFSW